MNLKYNFLSGLREVSLVVQDKLLQHLYGNKMEGTDPKCQSSHSPVYKLIANDNSLILCSAGSDVYEDSN